MRNIHNQNVAESAHYIIIFYTQELGTRFGNILFRTFEASASPLN